jgi:hypothetical protein
MTSAYFWFVRSCLAFENRNVRSGTCFRSVITQQCLPFSALRHYRQNGTFAAHMDSAVLSVRQCEDLTSAMICQSVGIGQYVSEQRLGSAELTAALLSSSGQPNDLWSTQPHWSRFKKSAFKLQVTFTIHVAGLTPS